MLPGTGYRLNMQANAGYNGIDYAPWPLFSWVDSTVLQKPTVKGIDDSIFFALLVSYVEEGPWWPMQNPNRGRKKEANG